MTCRLGVDVGGTFTDLLLIDEESGATRRDKVPPTPDDASRAVIGAARQLGAAAWRIAAPPATR